MRARTLALAAAVAVAAAAGVVAVFVWRRRRSSARVRATVRLGLPDGSVSTLDPSDPSTIELQTLAAGVRDSFTGGA